MTSYAVKAQSMTDVAAIIERARIEGRDLATALRIARATLGYLSSPKPTEIQITALKALDHHLDEISNGRTA
jgi:DNA-binding Xre family transcriptional regulator